MRIQIPKKMRTEIIEACNENDLSVKPAYGTDYKRGRKELESISIAVSSISWNDVEEYKKCYFENKIRSLVVETFKSIVFEYPDVD